MAESIKVSSLADLTALEGEKRQIISIVQEIIDKIKGVSQQEIKIQGAGSSKELLDISRDLSKSQNDLAGSLRNASKAIQEQAQASKGAAQAAKDLAAARKAEAQAAKELAAAAKAEAQAQKETNLAAKASAQADKEAAAAKLLSAKASTEQAAQDLLQTKSATEQVKAKQLQVRMEQQIQNEKDKTQKKIQQELQQQQRLSGAYDQLKAKYNLAATSAKNFGAQLGANSPEFLEAATAAQKYYQELIQIETAVGQSQRKVGQYENSTFALTQTLRELPSFGVSIKTGFLGISNNLPILFDEFKRVKDATGSAGQALKIFAGSMVGFNAISAIAIGLLTIFADKIFKSGDATENAALKTNVYNKAVEESKKQLDALSEGIKHAQDLGGVNVEVNNINVPAIQALNNELYDTRAKSIDATTTIAGLADEVDKLAHNFQNAEDTFMSNASPAAQEAYKSKTIEFLQDLSQADKDYYAAVKNAKTAQDEVLKKLAVEQGQQLITYREIARKKAEIEKETNDDARRAALESIRIQSDLTQKKHDLILSDDASTLEQRLASLKKIAQAQRDLAKGELANVLNDPTSSAGSRSSALQKDAAEQIKITLETQKKLQDVRDAYRERDYQATTRALEIQRTAVKSIDDKIAQDTHFSLESRLAAQRSSAQSEKEILDANYKLRLAQAGISDEEIQQLLRNKDYRVKDKKLTDKELLTLQLDYEDQLVTAQQAQADREIQVLRDELGKKEELQAKYLHNIERAYAILDTISTKGYSEEIVSLNDMLRKGEVSYEQYQKRRAEIDKRYAKQTAQGEIAFLEEQIKAYKGAEEAEIDAAQRVADIKEQLGLATNDQDRSLLAEKLKLAEDELQHAQDDADKKIALEKRVADAKKQLSDQAADYEKKKLEDIKEARKKLTDEFINLVEAVGTGIYDRQKNDVQDLIDALDKKKEKDLEVADATATTAQQKADQEKIIESRAAAQKEALERRQRQIDQERARFEKAMNVARIIYQTATGVSNALSGPPPAPPNPILAGIIAATGAVQLAKVLATPIPRYAKGTLYHPGGGALVGDGGQREVVQEPGGRVWLTPDKPTYVDSMPRGSKVFASLEKAAPALIGGTLRGSYFDRDSSGQAALAALQGVIKSEGKATRQAILGKRENHWTVKNGDISLTTKGGYNETTYLNKSLQF